MRLSLLNKLRCPIDKGSLTIGEQFKREDDHIMEGKLVCSLCGSAYEIGYGVPRMLPTAAAETSGEALSSLQQATIERFGFEWRHFKDWGWLPDYPRVENSEEKFFGGLVEHTRAAFWSKSLFHKNELHPGLTVLDAGCGNGRFTHQVAETGADVVGIDLGWGVQSAFDHLKSLPNVHIVRGDLFRLPFDDQSFDRVFSIGVLMHTGNAAAAFDSLARVLRPTGLIVAHVYGKGRISYEFIDLSIRKMTTKMPIRMQILFARGMAWMSRWLRSGGDVRKKLYSRFFSHLNLLPTEHHMFDWWSAPVATHHTQDEVHAWFNRNGLEILRTNPPFGDITAERSRRYHHASITVLGKKPRKE